MKKILVFVAILILTISTGCGETQSAENNLQPVGSEIQSMQIKIVVGNKIFDTILENNDAAQEFYKMLPLEITMNELNGNEKYFRLNKNLPSNDKRAGTIHTGDLMLWNSNTVVIFYENFSSGYSYTRLGKILNPENLANAVRRGNISVRFEK